jgi:hypothetical protein
MDGPEHPGQAAGFPRRYERFPGRTPGAEKLKLHRCILPFLGACDTFQIFRPASFHGNLPSSISDTLFRFPNSIVRCGCCTKSIKPTHGSLARFAPRDLPWALRIGHAKRVRRSMRLRKRYDSMVEVSRQSNAIRLE